MTQILSFPTQQDRELIQFCISAFAQGKTDRNSMMRQVAHIMGRYSISKIHMDGYVVKVTYYRDQPIVIMEGCGVHDQCPSCGASPELARYLRTHQENLQKDFDVITIFCLECGAIYDCMAPNGREAMW